MKKKLLTYLVLTIIVLLNAGCGTDTAKKNNANKVQKSENLEVKAESSVKIIPLPGKLFKQLYEEADYLDVIFEDLPFSMSQEDNKSIRQFLVNVDVNAPEKIDNSCVPMGHQVYQKEGEIIAEADFYVSAACTYYVFFIGGKKYHNKMLPNGIEFFNKLKSGNL